MRYSEIRPPADLSACVHRIWELEAGADALAEPIFPDGRAEIILHLGDPPVEAGASICQPRVMFVGQMTRALRLEPVSHLHAIGVRFTPTGARACLGIPLQALTDRIHTLDDLKGGAATAFQDALDASCTRRLRFEAIERALRRLLRRDVPCAQSVEDAVTLTMARGGRVTVDGLARATGVSARQLERRYLDAVGLTPKAFARTVRFHRALRGLQRGTSPAAVAAACGFSDQPHLAREFRRFAGVAARQVDLARVAFLQDATAGLDQD